MIIHKAVSDSDWVVIMSHGFRGSQDGGGRAVILADRIAAYNVNVIRYNFTPLTKITTQVAELANVVAYAKRHIATHIILLGRSMGGCASLIYAAQQHNVQGLCLWSTPADLTETFRLALGSAYDLLEKGKTVYVADEYGEAELRPALINDFSKYDLKECIQKIQIPLLVLHGSADAIVPVAQAQSLFAVANKPKKITIISNGDHQFSQHAQQAQNEVLLWLKRFGAGI